MARLMSSTELYQRIEETSDFVLVDVLSSEDYNREHIPGAINIPLDGLQEYARENLSKNQRIIVYGPDHDSELSARAAVVLEEMGYRKVSDFDGGIHAWKRAGYLTSAEIAAGASAAAATTGAATPRGRRSSLARPDGPRARRSSAGRAALGSIFDRDVGAVEGDVALGRLDRGEVLAAGRLRAAPLV